MNPENNEPRHVRGVGGRVSGAVGAGTKVPQPTDFLRGSLSAETEPAAIIADYWQAAKARYKRGDFPDYGSDDWKALDLEDPRKMAGLVAFAQLWLRYGDEIADDLNRQLRAPYELVHHATPEACAQAFRDMAAQQQHRRREAA
jgi:hypothetical protein